MKKQIEYTPVFSDIMDSNTTINSDENLKADKKTGISYLPWEQAAQTAELERLQKIRKEKTLVILYMVFQYVVIFLISVFEKADLFLIYVMIALIVCFLLRFVFLKRPLHKESFPLICIALTGVLPYLILCSGAKSYFDE